MNSSGEFLNDFEPNSEYSVAMTRKTLPQLADREPASCAIYYVPEAYEGDRKQVVGRQSAGAGFLEAFVRYARPAALDCLTTTEKSFEEFQRRVAEIASDPPPARWIRPHDLEALGRAGCLYTPGPIVSEPAWLRRHGHERLFSVCGITHSVATDRVVRGIRDYLIAPVQPWDALICTSEAALAAIRHIIESWTGYLASRGFVVPESPLRTVVIPLGVHLERFARTPEALAAGRTFRSRLGIDDDDVLALSFGRLTFLTKAHPTPLFRSCELAQRRLPPGKLHLVLVGQFPELVTRREFEAARQRFCPSVRVHVVDGANKEMAQSSWFAADLFVSLPDNVQESFGLTPVEAMAAGLPCVVSDWDGYKETVADGETGFRIPSTLPPPGAGREIAEELARGLYDHVTYLGIVGQSTAIDIDACARALSLLARDAGLRRRMGEAGRRRAEALFDWKDVMRRYVELWEELAAIRGSATAVGPRDHAREPVHPDFPDPFTLFRGYPTRSLAPGDVLRLADLDAVFVLESLRANILHVFAAPMLLESAAVDHLVARLAEGPCPVSELIADLTAHDERRMLRTLLWLYKYGLVAVEPAGDPER